MKSRCFTQLELCIFGSIWYIGPITIFVPFSVIKTDTFHYIFNQIKIVCGKPLLKLFIHTQTFWMYIEFRLAAKVRRVMTVFHIVNSFSFFTIYSFICYIRSLSWSLDLHSSPNVISWTKHCSNQNTIFVRTKHEYAFSNILIGKKSK